MNYAIGDSVEVREFGSWKPGVVVAVTPNAGPNGETLYVVEYRQPDGSKHVSGGKTHRMVRAI